MGSIKKKKFLHLGLAHYADNGRFGPSKMIFLETVKLNSKSLVSQRACSQYLSNNTTLYEIPQWEVLRNKDFPHLGLAHYADNGRFGPSNMNFSATNRSHPKSLVSQRTCAQYLSNNTTLYAIFKQEVF